MSSTPGRFVTVSATIVLVAAGLGGCGLLDGSSRVQESLDYLPAKSTSLVFVDSAAIAERLGVDDLETGASEADLDRWAEASQDEAYGSELRNWTRVMQEAAFSEFDVEWEATATYEDGLVRVTKLNDDADFDAIADDLEDAGYERSGEGDASVFRGDLSSADATTGLFGGRYPNTLLNLALVPDEHLIVTGDVSEGLDVINEDEDSLADSGRFDDLLDAAPGQDDLEFAALDLDPPCGLRNVSPEQQEQLFGGLGHPRRTGYFAVPEERLKVVRLFLDEEAAADDENGLVTFLDGPAAQTGLDADIDVSADGDSVVAEADFDDRQAITQAWSRGEGPFACAAE
ncbi:MULTISPECIES: hypothetical protein [unclassified Nocardioides]|uniref:hypothetical protein n=1 Tax=unclassified Nocardioides TaxID=2615069 RepID=UPI0006F1CD1D|nr:MULTISPECIES: hypothetical protein [unclassified Nocardioides]KRA31404.1 hypothetical protein ASD81_18375 [Nocardioides sp. Root614]KRA88024.1 hypothetical protein ASD84_18650 [Nocardioides sp. Root682]